MKLLVLVFVLLQLVSAAEAFRWTLHSSCYENIAYRDALIKALQTVKDRSAFCAPKINSILHPNYKKLAQLLVGTDGFSDKAKILKERFESFKNVNGPIGANSGFADSPDWTKRDNPVNNDFVIYCAPDIGEVDEVDPPVKIDRARQYILGPDSGLILIQKDIDDDKWNSRIMGVTQNTPSIQLTPDERTQTPDTITFNPLWLESRINGEGMFFSQETIDLMKKKEALDTLKEKWTDTNRPTPVDTLMDDLAGTLHHEMFHLSILGKQKDLPSEDPHRAYHWMDNFERKLIDNPELMALLALIFDLRNNYKAVVTETGEFEQ